MRRLFAASGAGTCIAALWRGFSHANMVDDLEFNTVEAGVAPKEVIERVAEMRRAATLAAFSTVSPSGVTFAPQNAAGAGIGGAKSSSDAASDTWTCHSCAHVMVNARTRSVCTRCRSIRADADAAVGVWRDDPRNWSCLACREFNFGDASESASKCRCCGEPRATAERMRRERLGQPGAIYVSIDRVVRWSCQKCAVTNLYANARCTSCTTPRWEVDAVCTGCATRQQLTKDAGAAPCRVCQRRMHGSQLAGQLRWVCACGGITPLPCVVCQRCRLPRRFASDDIERSVLATWDLKTATNWLCGCCNGVNTASRTVIRGVMNARHRTSSDSAEPVLFGNIVIGAPNSRTTKLLHGSAQCKRCSAPWHNRAVNGGQQWVCACATVNDVLLTTCKTCDLPREGTNVDMLSLWVRGDWACTRCHRHNYSDRSTCVCGDPRPRRPKAPSGAALL